ncbi:MAG TPA: PAS domain S-box protein [Bacteroidales bacterium]|nr:PAS domain S-box protein [Bacteroidales bacterium]
MKNSDPTNAASDNADHGRISHDSLHDDMCLFFEMSHDLFTVVSSEGRFLSVNNAWENLLGYSKDDLLKQSYTDFLHPDDVESSGREFARAFDGSDIRRFINRFRCKDGSVLWLEWYGKISADRKTMTLVGRDITDRKLLKESYLSRKM